MRLLFALHGYLPDGRGGTEVHAHALAKLLSREHEVRVFCREGDPKKPDFTVTRDRFEGIAVTRVNNLYSTMSEFEWTYKNDRMHELFEKELVDFKPDLVHIHHLTGLSTTIVETIKAGGLPLVMTLHDFWMVCPRGQRMTKELEICEDVDRNICFHCLAGIWPGLFANREGVRTVVDPRGRLAPEPLAEFDRHMAYILGLADLLITPSEFHRERMLDFPLPAERMVALPHGLDHGPYRGVMRAVRPVKRIGYIGSVIPVKGCHILIDAFRRLGRADIELHIHGEAFPFHDDRNYTERLKSRAIGQRNITFHGGYRPTDLPRLLANLDILVVPSLWWESFCLTIREGMLAGVPVVASDLGAMREALDGERDGLLFKAGDAQDLAERLDQLIHDDALRERLSNRGEAVKTLDQYVKELVPLYERAMATSAARAGSIIVAPPSFPKYPAPAVAPAAPVAAAPAAPPSPTAPPPAVPRAPKPTPPARPAAPAPAATPRPVAVVPPSPPPRRPAPAEPAARPHRPDDAARPTPTPAPIDATLLGGSRDVNLPAGVKPATGLSRKTRRTRRTRKHR